VFDFSSLRNQECLKTILTEDYLTEVAEITGFCQRGTKFTPLMFFDILLYNSSSDSNKSLNQLTVEVLSEHGIKISKQGIDKRFSDRSVEFVKTIFERVFTLQVQEEGIDSNWLAQFHHVRIKDSTRFDIPEEFNEILPGSGGSASKAGVCIQYEYDVKGGKILDLTITPANRPDVKDAKETMLNLEKGDLIIRDLGYFSLEVIEQIRLTQAYFISRIDSTTKVYTQKQGRIKEVNFDALRRLMVKQGLGRVELPVLIGKVARIPLRLIIELLPDDVYEKRMRKINKSNKKKNRRTSDEYARRARLNLFVTNVDQNIMAADAISATYKVRWQVELVFKAWKSTFGIDNSRKMKYVRWLCLLYAKLLVIVINWKVVMELRTHLFKNVRKMLSIDKCFKTLKDRMHSLRQAVKEGNESLPDFFNKIACVLSEKHWLEKRKKQMGFEKLLGL
jgi:hypothetical protein